MWSARPLQGQKENIGVLIQEGVIYKSEVRRSSRIIYYSLQDSVLFLISCILTYQQKKGKSQQPIPLLTSECSGEGCLGSSDFSDSGIKNEKIV